MTLIDKAEALLPCPFCGGEDAHVIPTRRNDKHRLYPFVRCMGCYLDLPGENDDYSPNGKTAIAAWNRRAIPARGVAVNIEDMARAIYDAMRFERKDKTPEWLNGGNSHAQVEARAAAARILAALSPAPDAREAALREAAAIAYPPLMHRKGKPGLWRRRRAQIAADILALIGEART